MVETVEHPTIGALKMLGIPFKFSDTECSVRRAPPTLGQHTDEILAASSATTPAAIAKLRAGQGRLKDQRMITGLSHVSIVVPDIEAAAKTLAERYGLDHRRAHGQRRAGRAARLRGACPAPRSS